MKHKEIINEIISDIGQRVNLDLELGLRKGITKELETGLLLVLHDGLDSELDWQLSAEIKKHY